MNSIRKVAGLVARIVFSSVILAGVIALLTTGGFEPAATRASAQGKDRLVTKKPWRVEPVKVVAVKNKKKANIEIGKAFDDDDDWLDGFTITVFNGSDKVVTAVAISMIFPRPPGDSRNKFAYDLYFGFSPIRPEYARRDPKKVFKRGETVQLEVRPQTYTRVKAALQRLGYPESINRIELSVLEVGFEDGSVLLSGTLYIQDPNNPSDPTKKIPAPKPISRNHHRIDHPKLPKSASSKPSLWATTLNFADQDEEECWEPVYNPPTNCPPTGLPPPFGETNPDCYASAVVNLR